MVVVDLDAKLRYDVEVGVGVDKAKILEVTEHFF